MLGSPLQPSPLFLVQPTKVTIFLYINNHLQHPKKHHVLRWVNSLAAASLAAGSRRDAGARWLAAVVGLTGARGTGPGGRAAAAPLGPSRCSEEWDTGITLV